MENVRFDSQGNELRVGDLVTVLRSYASGSEFEKGEVLKILEMFGTNGTRYRRPGELKRPILCSMDPSYTVKLNRDVSKKDIINELEKLKEEV